MQNCVHAPNMKIPKKKANMRIAATYRILNALVVHCNESDHNFDLQNVSLI